ncbi:MAG: CHASE3 domain-containing protein, partial [Sinobacteraceae bacterium]|nr:CHASE3 domain-containing protein [Nevskiaceae bacterium]
MTDTVQRSPGADTVQRSPDSQSRRRRLLFVGSFIGALTAILAIGFVSYLELSQLAESGARVQHSYELLQTLDDLTSSLTDAETNQRGFLLTQDASYVTQFEEASAQVRLAVTELRRLASDEATEVAIAHLGKLAGAKLQELRDSLHNSQAGHKHAALENVADGRSQRLMTAFQRDSADLETMQRRLLDQRREREQRARLWSGVVLAATIVLSLLLVVAAAMISRRFEDRRRMLENEITERRRAEDYRESLLASERTARAEAERATQLKDEFVATLSHELRTPLNAIVGWAGILQMDRRAETVQQGVEVIERNAKLQAQMIEDLLDMSRILSGKLLFEVRKMDLGPLAKAAVAGLQPTANAKGVRLQMQIEASQFVNGDPARLQQVVWNLLNNAIKFTPEGGTVQVRVHTSGNQTELIVADSGQGIHPEFLPYVFDRFRQGDASTTRRHGGLGLGLSIVKSLVEMHGGTVSAHSAGEGQGATFTVRIPAVPAHVRVREEALLSAPLTAPRLTRELGGVRILVVDD